MLEYYTDISFYEKLEGLTIENNKKPKNKRKKKNALVNEAVDFVTEKYKEYIDNVTEKDDEYIKNDDNADICKELL